MLGGILIYFLGVLTGALLAGWTPSGLAHWEKRRWFRKAQRTEDRMIDLVNREADKYRRSKSL